MDNWRFQHLKSSLSLSIKSREDPSWSRTAEKLMQSLDRAGIKYSSKAGEIAEFEINGLKIGLVAFSFGSSPRSVVHPESALREIGSLSPHYDILLVSVHGGSEGMPALHVRNESEFFRW